MNGGVPEHSSCVKSTQLLSKSTLYPAQEIQWLFWLVNNEHFSLFKSSLQFNVLFGDWRANTSCHLCIYTGMGSGIKALAGWLAYFYLKQLRLTISPYIRYTITDKKESLCTTLILFARWEKMKKFLKYLINYCQNKIFINLQNITLKYLEISFLKSWSHIEAFKPVCAAQLAMFLQSSYFQF